MLRRSVPTDNAGMARRTSCAAADVPAPGFSMLTRPPRFLPKGDERDFLFHFSTLAKSDNFLRSTNEFVEAAR